MTSAVAVDLAALRRVRHRRIWIVVAAVATTIVLGWVGVVHGVTDISSARLLATLLPWGDRIAQPFDWMEWTALIDLRLPRIAVAVVAGAGLAWCGCAMQIITGNPMASPFTTGISHAAAFGAALSMLGSVAIAGSATAGTIVCAFVMACLCSVLVVAIAGVSRVGPTALVLTGVAISYLFAALAAGLQYAADEQQLSAIVRWTFGDLGRATWPQIAVIAVVVAGAGVYVTGNAGRYQRLAAGDDVARSLGVAVGRLRLETGLMITLVSATIVSVTGVIGFVGLVAPHIASMLVGADERFRIPVAGIIGAAVVLAADLVGRLVFSPVIVPVGIVVSLVGVPMFLWLIIREGKRSRT
ncbi:FecCD family ABC transporter permease [Tsukamurella pseudospumae]|uniref:Iron ABC transporter permease n=1 Tax=Tsukamurella pseudospumae TaxID=239498 RepID=A0A137YZE3_9ACTN|nr:iron ABC transporter permease [Tsukamurella pseudospumae]KXO91322.1 iron ABC transporter permease [Tsukamurella pseudospumae]